MKVDLADRGAIADLFARERFERVVHLGAQAGVRYSVEAPFAYLDSNLTGTLTVLEGCRHNGVEHLVFASTSSVYGANTRMPFSVHQGVDHPLSLYGATKKSNELMAHAYSSLYGLPVTGLRFFTVYGPFGRPDMALFIFTKAILAGKPIDVFNYGHHRRDFTYVGDIVEGVVRAMRPYRRSQAGSGTASGRIRLPARRRIVSTTSATSSPSSFCAISRSSKTASVAKRTRTCSHCSRVTCPTPGPTLTISLRTSVTARARPSSRACAASSIGISTITK